MFGEKLKTFTAFFPKVFENKKYLMIIVVIGCIGILLIGFSDWFTPQKTQISNSAYTEINLEEYVENLEKKTQEMVLSINGAGKSKVMITAETSLETEYATDDDISNDFKTNTADKQQSNNKKTETVIIESNGDKNALVTTVKEPKIRGVLILCEGADTPKVKENVTEAVKTVLGVSYNKICVIKLKT